MRTIFTLLCLVSAVASQAQIKIGLKVAPQMTWATSDNKNTTSNGSRVNVSYGLMIDKYFTENYALGTEVCINTYGANLNLRQSKFTNILKKSDNSNYAATEDLKYDYRLQYIQVPLLLKMRTNEIGYLRYYAEFGFNFGFLFKSKADVDMDQLSLTNVNINSPDEEDEFEIQTARYSDKVSSLRTSLVVGAGIQYGLAGNAAIVAGIRYDNGFTSFTSDDRFTTTLNYLALNLGLLF